jgi:long-chain acyl-CoA synthetase
MLDCYDSTLLISSEKVDYPGKYVGLATVLDDGEPLAEYTFPNPDDMCAIVFTTGTTGKAKGVMLDHKYAVFHSGIDIEAFSYTEDDVFLWNHPIDKLNGVYLFGAAFMTGATAVHYGDIAFVGGFFEAIATHSVSLIRVTVTSAVLLLRAMPGAFAKYAGQIRAMGFSTGPLDEKYKRSLRNALQHTRLMLFYASTETGCMAMLDFSEDTVRENCIGKLLPGREISFKDLNGSDIENPSSANPGVFVCKGGFMTSGYWKEPELTSQTIIDGGVLMTDIGYLGADGLYYLISRKDDVIATGGHKVAPYEIETIVMRIPGVRECACIAVPDTILGSVPKLFVVMEEGTEFSVTRIHAFMASHLETYKLPRYTVEIDALPRTSANQKIDRKKLIEYA